MPRMIQAKQELRTALQAALAQVLGEHSTQAGRAADATLPSAQFESPKQAAHGDLAITAAMPLARVLKKSPRDIAQALVQALQAQAAVQRWVAGLDIAGPGFINLRLSAAAKQAVVAEVLRAGASFGQQARSGKQVMVEFVSANPTGPLHVGHGRNAALGDCMCNLLQSQGAEVLREFYYNDAGVQINNLGLSVQRRLQGLKPGDAAWPEQAYNGEYIADIAADFLARKTVQADDRSFTASGDINDLDSITQFAVAFLRHEQDLDLQAFGVHFDHYFLESSLYSGGKLEDTVGRLVASGKTYEEGGALWLRTTEYGDDKDRVMRKQDGSYTYFVPDVAYHLNKFERGYTQVINVQGADHHGTVARVRAGLQAVGLGIPQGYPDYVLYKMIAVVKDGKEVKMSKRAGTSVSVRDLIDWTSRDAVRFFLASRKSDTEFTFDVDLARKTNDENPVFYVQYAHARICSILNKANVQTQDGSLGQAQLALLVAPSEAALMMKLAEYPEMLSRATADLAPHDVTFYVRELAAAFHTYYASERVLVDDAALAQARLALLAATAQVLRNALAILGVSAPEAMAREEAPTAETTA
jgi:arginyl-tRNA synthetase